MCELDGFELQFSQKTKHVHLPPARSLFMLTLVSVIDCE